MKIGLFHFINVKMIMFILDSLVREKVLGGYCLIPWGVNVTKEEVSGKTIWTVDTLLDEKMVQVNGERT